MLDLRGPDPGESDEEVELGKTICTATEASGPCGHFAIGLYRAECEHGHIGEGPLCFCHARPPSICREEVPCQITLTRISEDQWN